MAKAMAGRFPARWPPSGFLFVVALLFLMTDGVLLRGDAMPVGINYGQIADNLPSPSRVSCRGCSVRWR
ncbi:unnamed protein product [Urochloa humidicola]